MSIDCEEFTLEAERLLLGNKNEATCRTIVSRAYYGAYHLADAWHKDLPRPGIPLPNCGQHKNLISQLYHPTTKDQTLADGSRSLGYRLKGLYFSRIKADYRLDQDMSCKEAHNAVAKSRSIHNQFGP